jgi:hypothetical protein
MNETKTAKSTSKDGLLPFNRRTLLIGGSVIFLIVVATFLATRILGPDGERVAAATDGLEAAASGITLNDELSDVGADLAERPERSQSERIARIQSGIQGLADEAARNPELAEPLAAATRASADAADSLERVAGALDTAHAELENAGKTDARNLDRRANSLKRRLDYRAYIQSLSQAFELFEKAVDEAAAILADENALSDEGLDRLRQTREAIARQIPVVGEIGKRLMRSIDRTRARLVARSYELRSVTGPAECGTSSKGSTVVISSGRMPCDEAVRVANRYEGTDSVPGWSCGGQAVTLSGFTLDRATGRGCVRGARVVSIYNADLAAEAERQAEAGPSDCGSKRLISSTGTPSDFPLTATGVSCSEATPIAQGFWGSGTETSATVDTFSCVQKTIGWSPGEVAFVCSKGEKNVTAFWLDQEGDGGF